MENNYESKRKLLTTIIILLAVIIIVIMAINILDSSKDTTIESIISEDEETNYTIVDNGSKINTSEEVIEDKTVGKILIEKSSIVYSNRTSKLVSKVTNDNVARDNLRFNVKFMDNNDNVIAEAIGFVGSIKANETKYIDAYITNDVSDAKDIVYEIIE